MELEIFVCTNESLLSHSGHAASSRKQKEIKKALSVLRHNQEEAEFLLEKTSRVIESIGQMREQLFKVEFIVYEEMAA